MKPPDPDILSGCCLIMNIVTISGFSADDPNSRSQLLLEAFEILNIYLRVLSAQAHFKPSQAKPSPFSANTTYIVIGDWEA